MTISRFSKTDDAGVFEIKSMVVLQRVASTSLDAVLGASKTSKSQLYHYFGDKDDLVLAVIQRQTECVLAPSPKRPKTPLGSQTQDFGARAVHRPFVLLGEIKVDGHRLPQDHLTIHEGRNPRIRIEF